MAALANLTREERLGLAIAAVAHAALFAALALQDRAPPKQLAQGEAIAVSLADEVSLTSTAPDPAAVPQASVAPDLAAEPSPPPPAPLPRPAPVEAVREPPPRPVERTETPRPAPTRAARPAPAPSPTRAARPAPAPTQSARPAPQPSPESRRAGGSRIGDDFLAGANTSQSSERAGTPAATFGPAERASLSQAINRQLKPHWSAPQGVDAELLVTELRFELNLDGSLRGTPRVVSQSGINDSNRPQARLHAERAIRAVQLAAPFDLPEEFYDQWRRVTSWRFDRRL